MRTVIDDLRRSSDARERALALASGKKVSEWFAADAQATTDANSTKPAADSALADLAAARPEDVLVQWIAATASGGTRDAAAIANVQHLDKDNAAAWALSLNDAAADAQQTLQHMAASHRYDEHSAEIAAIWLTAVKRHAVPADTIGRIQAQSTFSEDDIKANTAAILAATSAVDASPNASINAACASANDARRPFCIATARLMFDGGHTLMANIIGEMLLRKFHALNAQDLLQARKLAWWRENSMSIITDGPNGMAISLYMHDMLATGSESEALRLAATRAGKAEPPADWKSQSEKKAAKDATPKQ